MKPIRIQRSRKEKQVSPNGLPIVYVGRPTKWGNPFVVGKYIHETWFESLSIEDRNLYFGEPEKKVETNKEALILFNKYALQDIEGDISELRGKNLSCWCGLGESCHASALLDLANNGLAL